LTTGYPPDIIEPSVQLYPEDTMKMSIKVILVAAIVILAAVLSLLHMGRKIEVNTDKRVEGLSGELCEVLYLASLAPNSHNAQMWKVKIDTEEQTVVIGLDKNRRFPAVDPHDREMAISLGCYAGMLTEALGAYGYKYDIEYLSGDDYIEIRYDKVTDAILQDRIDRIYKRHTDKSAFTAAALSDEQVGKLVLHDNVFYYPKGTEYFSYIRDNMLAAITQQSYDRAKAEELAGWLRLFNRETVEKKDGLPAEQLGLTGMVKSLYYLTTTHDSAKNDSFARQSIDTASKQLDGCAGFLAITSGGSREELLTCGMQLVKIWLSAVECGVSVHPMSAILEEEPYRSLIKQDLGLKEQPQMVMRLGIADDYGENAAIRRDLADYITVEEN